MKTRNRTYTQETNQENSIISGLPFYLRTWCINGVFQTGTILFFIALLLTGLSSESSPFTYIYFLASGIPLSIVLIGLHFLFTSILKKRFPKGYENLLQVGKVEGIQEKETLQKSGYQDRLRVYETEKIISQNKENIVHHQHYTKTNYYKKILSNKKIKENILNELIFIFFLWGFITYFIKTTEDLRYPMIFLIFVLILKSINQSIKIVKQYRTSELLILTQHSKKIFSHYGENSIMVIKK